MGDSKVVDVKSLSLTSLVDIFEYFIRGIYHLK